jgi:hypothetical protein
VVSPLALPVTPDVEPLLPDAVLAGQIAIPTARRGATSLLWRLLAGPSSAGRLCAVVGGDQLYPLAATAAGADLDRIVFVSVTGPDQTLSALGALCEGVPVVVASTRGLTARQTQRAAARARRSGSAIIWREHTPVAGVDARLDPVACEWIGLRPNEGRRWGSGRVTRAGCWWPPRGAAAAERIVGAAAAPDESRRRRVLLCCRGRCRGCAGAP